MNKLNIREFSSLVCFPILALFSGIGTYNLIRISKVDSYISIIFSYLFGFILIGLFIYILNYKKELNITQKINYLFGKYLGFIINIIINIIVLITGVVLLYNISNFAISQFLSDTPLLVFMILLSIVLIYNVSEGIKNISRVSIIFLAIIIILTIISTLGTIPNFELSNILPVLENGIITPIGGGIIFSLMNTIPILTLLIIPKNDIHNNKKINKYIIIFYTLAFVFLLIEMVLTIGSLGIILSTLYQYPEYTFLKKISLFSFIDRIENFIYIKWMLSSVISLSLVIYYISTNINNKSKKIIPTIIMIILITISLLLFKDNTIFYNFSYYIYPYINLLLLIIILVISGNIFIRKKLLNDK